MKRNLRSIRDGTESSRSFTGEGSNWNQFLGSAAATALSKRSYSTRPSVVRRLWHVPLPKKDDNSKTLDTIGGNLEDSRSIHHDSGSEQESDHGSAEDGIKLSAGFRISEQDWQSVKGSGKSQEPPKELNSTKEGKNVNVEASSDPAVDPKSVHSDHNVKNQPHSESSRGKRSWSSATGVPSTKCTAGTVTRSPVTVRSDDATQSFASESGYSEDYFRLMAHIFNCIFR